MDGIFVSVHPSHILGDPAFVMVLFGFVYARIGKVKVKSLVEKGQFAESAFQRVEIKSELTAKNFSIGHEGDLGPGTLAGPDVPYLGNRPTPLILLGINAPVAANLRLGPDRKRRDRFGSHAM